MRGDGYTILSDGRVIPNDGFTLLPDGRVVPNDGSTHSGDGANKGSDGTSGIDGTNTNFSESSTEEKVPYHVFGIRNGMSSCAATF